MIKLLNEKNIHLIGKVLFFILSLFVFVHYISFPIMMYLKGYLMNFDYGILFQSTSMIAQGKMPFLYNRGVLAWADNQDYFQIFLSIAHFFPNPHIALLLIHTFGVVSVGFLVFYIARSLNFGHLSYALAIFTWYHFLMVSMNADLVHTESFATLFVALMLFSIIFKKRTSFWLSLLLAISCKEDVAISCGFLLFVSFWIPEFNDYCKKDRQLAFCICLLVFFINFLVVLPMAKSSTCEWLGTSILNGSTGAPASPYFQDLFRNYSDFNFYKEHFFNIDVAKYLLKIYWPLIPFLLTLNWLIILPLPAILINILGGNYLIMGKFHYDHTIFAILLVLIFISIIRLKESNSLNFRIYSIMLLSIFSSNYLVWPQCKLSEVFTSSYWVFEKKPRVIVGDELKNIIPENSIIAADYHYLSYLAGKHDKVFMLPMPFENKYFGLYGTCERLNKKIIPDIAIFELNKTDTLKATKKYRKNYIVKDIASINLRVLLKPNFSKKNEVLELVGRWDKK